MTAVLEPGTAPATDEPTAPDAVPSEPRRIVVLAPKGGVGRTMVATNLAVALAARTPGEVALVDVALSFGDVATALLLDPRVGFGLLARAPRPLAASAIAGLLVQHSSGLHVLCGPDTPVAGEAITPDDVTATLAAVAAAVPTTVVDTGAGLDAATLAAVEQATDLVLVANPDVASILGLRQALDILDRLGLRAAARHLVVNRHGLRAGVDPDDIESTVGLAVAASIPDDRAVAVAMNEGHPLVGTNPRAPAARALQGLADLLSTPSTTPSTGGARLRRRSAG